jgi:hypothetical protein
MTPVKLEHVFEGCPKVTADFELNHNAFFDRAVTIPLF